jgi:hypothetical protein
VGKADEALAGVLDFQRGIDGERDRECKREGIEPASLGGSHAVTGQEGGAPTQNEEQEEDHRGRVHIEWVLAGGGDIDHGIQGGEQHFHRQRPETAKNNASDARSHAFATLS